MSKFVNRRSNRPQAYTETPRQNRKKTGSKSTSQNRFDRVQSNPTSIVSNTAPSKNLESKQKESKESIDNSINPRQELTLQESQKCSDISKAEEAKSLDSSNKDIDCLIEIGLKQYQQKQYQQGINTLQEVLKVESKNAKANYWLGMCYYQLQQLEMAINHFVKATSSTNNQLACVEAFFWLGEIYRQQQQIKPAIANYQKFLAFAPHSPYAFLASEHLLAIRFGWLID